jgi:hypothetical protein
MSNNDLWPELSPDLNFETPYSILREQAMFLSQKTNRLLDATVGHPMKASGTDFEIVLYVRAPLLNNYSIEILDVLYPVEMYPLSISTEFVDYLIKANEPTDFKNKLSMILSSQKVKDILQTLLIQSRQVSE